MEDEKWRLLVIDSSKTAGNVPHFVLKIYIFLAITFFFIDYKQLTT